MRWQLRLGGPARALAGQRQALVSIEARLRRALRHSVTHAARDPAQLGARLVRAMQRQRERQTHLLQAAAQRLAALDPHRVLARGYAWMTDAAGRPVLSVQAVAPGVQLVAVWSDGHARVEVLDVQPQEPSPPAVP